MGDDDLNETTRGDAKDQFTQEEERKLADAMQKAHDRDALAEEKRRKLESDR